MLLLYLLQLVSWHARPPAFLSYFVPSKFINLPSSAFQVQLFEDQFNPNIVTLSAVGLGQSREDESVQMVEELAQTDTTLVTSQDHSRFVYWNPSTYAVMSTLHVYTGSGRRPYTGAKPILEAMTSLRMELLQRYVSEQYERLRTPCFMWWQTNHKGIQNKIEIARDLDMFGKRVHEAIITSFAYYSAS